MNMIKLAQSTLLVFGLLVLGARVGAQEGQFHLEEARIADVHSAIQEGQLTCQGLVQMYIDRAEAYNGVTNQLVTNDGEPIDSVPGMVRAGSAVEYPTETRAITEFLPNFLSDSKRFYSFRRKKGEPIYFGLYGFKTSA